MGTKEQYNWFNDPRNFMPNYDFGPGLRGSAQFAKDSFDYMAGMAAGMQRKPYRSRARWAFKGSRGTKARRKSVAQQKTITAPMARRIDTKYWDYLTGITNLRSTSAISYQINNIAQGAAEGQRIGNDIRVLKLLVSIELSHGSSIEDHTYRLIFFVDKTGNSNAAVPATNLFLADPAGNVTPQSLRNITNLEDYQILMDKMFCIPINSTQSHGRRVYQFEIKTSIGQRFSGAGGGTIVKNPIHAILMVNLPNVTTGAGGYLSVRTIYSDIC